MENDNEVEIMEVTSAEEAQEEDIAGRSQCTPNSLTEGMFNEANLSSETEPKNPNDFSIKAAGLFNLGNTCFLNSLLQALRFTPGFQEQLLKYDKSITDKVKQENFFIADHDACKALIVRQLFALFVTMSDADADDTSSEIFSARQFLDSLIAANEMFDGNDQHDPHEALSTILDAVDVVHHLTVMDSESVNMEQQESLSSCFDGQSAVTTICAQCETSSTRKERLNGLSVPMERQKSTRSIRNGYMDNISNGAISDSEDDETGNGEGEDNMWMIRGWARSQWLNDNNKYFCSECNHRSEAVQVSSLDTVPEALVFHLKRFATTVNYETGVCKSIKITDRRLTPLFISMKDIRSGSVIGKSLTKTESEQNDRLGYALYAIVIHSGQRLNSGHYYSLIQMPLGYIRPANHTNVIYHNRTYSFPVVNGQREMTDPSQLLSGNWLKFDDEKVTSIELDEELSKFTAASTYLLFYCSAVQVHFSQFV